MECSRIIGLPSNFLLFDQMNTNKNIRNSVVILSSSSIILFAMFHYRDVLLTFIPPFFANNYIAFFRFVSFLLIPAIIYLILTDRNRYALSFSVIYILCQTFSLGFQQLISLSWHELLLNIIGVGVVIFVFRKQPNINAFLRRLLLVFGALYICWLLFLTVFSFEIDVFSSLLLYTLFAYFLFSKVEDQNYLVPKLLTFYILSFVLISVNMNCNVEYEMDVVKINWSPKNLWNQCVFLYLLFFGGVILNLGATQNLRAKKSFNK